MAAFPRVALIFALLASAGAASAAAAAALPAEKLLGAATASPVAKVHHDSRYEDRGPAHYRPYHHRRYYRGEVVDAPFVHVSSGRRGQHVVAPFVDLWTPS